MLILDSLLSRPQSTVSAVAADIGQPPGAVWQEAHQLLRLGVLRSDAPERVATARRYTI
jgi:DNA-binding IclR family transcriptional regulator